MLRNYQVSGDFPCCSCHTRNVFLCNSRPREPQPSKWHCLVSCVNLCLLPLFFDMQIIRSISVCLCAASEIDPLTLIPCTKIQVVPAVCYFMNYIDFRTIDQPPDSYCGHCAIVRLSFSLSPRFLSNVDFLACG